MRFPRILLVVPLLALGIYLPFAGPTPPPPPAGVVGMTHETFSTTVVDVTCGDTLTLQNDSRWAHIIVPGKGGSLIPNADVPIARRELMESTDVYTTGAWEHAGTFYITCTVHPTMTMKVVVSGCCCAST